MRKNIRKNISIKSRKSFSLNNKKKSNPKRMQIPSKIKVKKKKKVARKYIIDNLYIHRSLSSPFPRIKRRGSLELVTQLEEEWTLNRCTYVFRFSSRLSPLLDFLQSARNFVSCPLRALFAPLKVGRICGEDDGRGGSFQTTHSNGLGEKV